MSMKVCFIGAGGVKFTRGILADILAVPEFADIEVAFTDINEDNLRLVTDICQRDIEANGLGIRIQSTADRREAIRGARYVFNCVRVGGLEAFAHDVDIPLKYGVDQCVGDTLCAGGLMYAQRCIPAALAFCRDIAEVGDRNALFLNYTNPMAMVTWACAREGHGVDTVGLCHGVQNGHRLIAEVFDLPLEAIDIVCAGINHQTWYLRIRHGDEDLAGRLLERMRQHPRVREEEKVRIDVLERFGYLSTESNGHLSEYLAWYRKREDEVARWIDTSRWIHGETGGYLRICTEGRNWFAEASRTWRDQPPLRFDYDARSHEHGGYILEARETGRIYRGHFNRVNGSTITNLPPDAVIEGPGYVDRNGITMAPVGDLPPGCAAICQQSVNVQRLGVEAALTGDITLLRQAALLDPLTGAVCTPPEIDRMLDEMLVATAPWLPQWQDEMPRARARLADPGRQVPTREGYRGAVRKAVKSVDELKRDRSELGKLASFDMG